MSVIFGMMRRRRNVKVPKPKKQKDITPKIDVVWSELVKVRAGHKCEYCGSRTTLNSHHVFTKNNRATRWDPDNGMCLCAFHHRLGNFSAHGSPAFTDWMKEYRGKKWYEDWKAKSNEIVKHSRARKALIMEDMNEQIKEVSNG